MAEPLQPASAPATRTADGTDSMDFLNDNRIHVKHGSLFVDPYLVLHPRELDPKNEARLRKKLTLTYTLNNPSFFESPERTAVALHLSQMLPVSLTSKRSRLMEEVKKFNQSVDHGQDPELVKELTDKLHPFTAIVRDTAKNPQNDPVGTEMLKNGIATYLLVREKLTQNGYFDVLTNYTPRLMNADQVLNDLADKIGLPPIAMRAAALKDGVDGVGKLLGIDPRYVADVKALSRHIADRDYGYNIVEHWHIGRQLLGLDATLEQKIAAGLQARIDAKVNEFRGRVKQYYNIPEPVKAEEKRIAKALDLVEPIQRKLMYALGYEICFTPEVTADDIAFHPGIYGLHRKAANNLNDFRGTYRVYFSGKGDLEGSMRTLVHEVAHNLWPDHFSKEDVARIDQLAMEDTLRFEALSKLVDEHFPELENLLKAYKAEDTAQKPAELARANALFAQYGLKADDVFPHLTDAHEFEYIIKHAATTLNVEGERYSRSGYDSPQERFREVISRFAELKQVRYRGAPELLTFVAPGLNEIFEKHYLPHLERVYADLAKAMPAGSSVTESMADMVPQEPKPEAPKPEERIDQPKVEQRPGAAEGQGIAMCNSTVSASPNGLSLNALFGGTRMAPALQTLNGMHACHSA